jgi:molybdopterin converting factor small subunit
LVVDGRHVKTPTQLRNVTGLETAVEDGDEITILPAVAGGV